jgi:hypothetical protein
MSFRMMKVAASFGGFPAALSWVVFDLKVGVEAACDERGPVQSLRTMALLPAMKTRPFHHPD